MPPRLVMELCAESAGRRNGMPVEHLPHARQPRLLLRLRSDPLARHNGEDRLAELRQQPGALGGALHVMPLKTPNVFASRQRQLIVPG